MRALPLLLAALVVGAAAAGATGDIGGSVAASPAPGDATPTPHPAAIDAAVPVAQTAANGTTLQQITVLDVPAGAVSRATVGEHYVDLGPGVALATNATSDRLQTLATVERIEAAETAETRQERLREALRGLEADVDDLERRQTTAVAAFGRGEQSARELLVSLVRVGMAAEELDTRRSRLEALAADTRGFDINQGRLASIGNRLSAFTGPVRSHAAAVLAGEAAPHRFYLATGPESVTVTTLLDDDYLRESYRGDLRDGDGAPIELEVALDVVATSYPVIWNTTREQTQVFGGGETYPVRIAHSRGELTAFVDSDARVVYAEHQRRPLGTVVADQRIERVVDGQRVTVNHTYPGGPVRIDVVDDATGDPVDANVSLISGPSDPTPLGATGEDGFLWTLSPDGQYTVVVDDRREEGVVVRPGDPPQMGLAGGDAPGGTGNATTGTTTPTPTAVRGDVTSLYIR
jgi:hypothetical protein